MTGAKKLHIRTWGCQMNVYDSDRMVDLLAAQGWQTTDDAEAADLVILNTCHIREKATEKVFSDLGRLKRGREDRMIAVAGCVAQAEGEEITARAPWVDLVFGPQTYHTLPDMVAAAERARRGGDHARLVNTDFPTVSKFDHLPDAGRVTGGSAFLSVQEGCDKFCTFCVVPYTRGAEYSRPVAAILAEARSLIAAGAVEITLLGQNVNAFHGEGPDGRDWGLGALIRRLADLPGLQRLRYTTSHPRDMDDALIEAHGAVDSLMPFLHLPVQSGSDRILAAMNRKHRADDFRRIVDRLRAARPDLALSSDFIVGFPGETDRDFADTLRLVREIGFVQAYSFKYSPRPGTPAAEMGDPVPAAVADDRLQSLQQVLNEQQGAFNRRTVGQRVPVLFDRAGRQPGQLLGRTPWMQVVHAQAPERLLGRIVDVDVTGAGPNSLAGSLALADPAPLAPAVATPAAEVPA